MPAKKAAKKSAKKAAKKAAAKHAEPIKKASKDTRRAYEHLGRVQAIASVLTPDETEAARTLAGFAEQALIGSQPEDAAEFLRAAEHSLFGTLAKRQPADESLVPALLEAISDEYDRKLEKANEHGGCKKAPEPIRELYRAMLSEAAACMKGKRYRAALEFARGAEALTHADGRLLLPTPIGAKKLQR